MWAKHVDLLVDGVQIHLPIPGQGIGFSFDTPPKAMVDEINATNSVLSFLSRTQGGVPLRFDIHQFVLKDPGTREGMAFEVKLRIPEPPGELEVSGKAGPWRSDDPAQTPVDGTYSLRGADLGVFVGIRGLLSSQGKFNGQIRNIEVQGSTDTPNFQVSRSPHKVHVTGDFRALVNGTNGGVTLEEIHAAFGKTRVESNGKVEGDTEKRANLKISGADGRIQDVLLLFIQAPASPMTGNLAFRATGEVPGVINGFVQKVRLAADFEISNALLTTPETQHKMDNLSQEAQGEKQTDDPETAKSSLVGHVELRDGVANFTDLKYRVPGALAHLHGNYDLISEKIDMHGLLLMRADLPHATSGFKSLLLKPINVFLRKNHHGGARIPVTLTGTYDHPICKTAPM